MAASPVEWGWEEGAPGSLTLSLAEHLSQQRSG